MPERIVHTIAPVFDGESRILMLGTMPSPKSREAGFYYGHPQNRFWPVLAAVLGEDAPDTTQRRRALLLRHRIALWDVLQSCTISGAEDASIREPVANDLTLITRSAPIRAVFATGKKAAALYERYCRERVGMPVTCLPSTSPANRRCSDEALTAAYRAILPHLA